MGPLYVFSLRFEHRAAVERGFARVQERDAVESCRVEPAELRIRFLAPEKIGAPLLARIYEGGGLVWCERHLLRALRPEA